jgi:LysR family transcriptional regulator of beta-lactamase
VAHLAGLEPAAQALHAFSEAAGVPVSVVKGPMFDSARLMTDAALESFGVALVAPVVSRSELETGRLTAPFRIEAQFGGFWLTHLTTRPISGAMAAVRSWLLTKTAET